MTDHAVGAERVTDEQVEHVATEIRRTDWGDSAWARHGGNTSPAWPRYLRYASAALEADSAVATPDEGDGLRFVCDFCDRVLTEPGGLVFSPPAPSKKWLVSKYHVCVECWDEKLCRALASSDVDAETE
jgi:hypothetical protein